MEGLNQNERIVWSCWETKTPREVVREAASKGTHLNLAYKYLETKLNWDKSTAVEWFTSEVMFHIENMYFFTIVYILYAFGRFSPGLSSYYPENSISRHLMFLKKSM